METGPKEWSEVEKEVSGEVEGDCGLDTKRRRRPRLSNAAPETVVVDSTDEDASIGEDGRSVSLEEDQGTKFVGSDAAPSKSIETEFCDEEKKLENGDSAFNDIWDDLQSVPKAGEKEDCNHIEVVNGPNLLIDSIENVEDEIVASADPETQIHVHDEATVNLKLDVLELDLEKVLEEQETHDLFCPNCHSCITKRVIMRKRKRKVQDFRHEELPEKVHVRPNVVDTPTEIETSHDDGPDVFRCLSCFSFFVPTENGFSIFRIFRKREESANVRVPNIQSSGQTSTGDRKWLSSIFKPESSKNKGNEAAQLQPQLEVSFGGDHNLEGITASPIPSATAQFPIVIEVSSGGDRLGNENKNAVALPASEAVNDGENYSTILKINSDDDDDIMPVIISKPARPGGIYQNNHDTVAIIPPSTLFLPHDVDAIKPVVAIEPSSSQPDLSISISAAQPTVFLPLGGDVQINVSNPMLVEPRRENDWEVLKSIVYGGLIESIASLGVISSAAGAKTSTLNVVALGMANLIGGFFVMLHDLSELKSSAPSNQHDEQTGRYWKLLGRKSNFGLHVTVAMMSYIFFGLLPPIIYGFTFRERDIQEDKIIAVASSSLLCIALLSIGKASVSQPKSYIKTFLYYLGLGFSASGLSFVAGVIIHKFLNQLGLFEHEPPLPPLPPPSIDLLGVFSGLPSWKSQ